MTKHREELCKFRLIPCTTTGCKEATLYGEVTKHRDELCKFRLILCPGKLCKELMPLSSLLVFSERLGVASLVFPFSWARLGPFQMRSLVKLCPMWLVTWTPVEKVVEGGAS